MRTARLPPKRKRSTPLFGDIFQPTRSTPPLSAKIEKSTTLDKEKTKNETTSAAKRQRQSQEACQNEDVFILASEDVSFSLPSKKHRTNEELCQHEKEKSKTPKNEKPKRSATRKQPPSYKVSQSPDLSLSRDVSADSNKHHTKHGPACQNKVTAGNNELKRALEIPKALLPFLEKQNHIRAFDYRTTTMPLTHKPTVVAASYFRWKLCIEMSKIDRKGLRGYRQCEANRPWHVIKEELELVLHLAMLKQNKKSLNYSTLVAYPLSQWCEIKETRKQLFSTETAYRPLAAETMVRQGEELVVVRLPSAMAHTLYKEVVTLRFDDTMSEDERIAQLISFDTTRKKATATSHADTTPPSHYVCHCGVGGHWRKDCEKGRRMAPTGIPRAFLKPSTVDTQLYTSVPVYIDDDGSEVQPVYPNFVIPGGGQP